eukprot:107803-Pelagomonas_calceolata.AAC.1
MVNPDVCKVKSPSEAFCVLYNKCQPRKGASRNNAYLKPPDALSTLVTKNTLQHRNVLGIWHALCTLKETVHMDIKPG